MAYLFVTSDRCVNDTLSISPKIPNISRRIKKFKRLIRKKILMMIEESRRGKKH